MVGKSIFSNSICKFMATKSLMISFLMAFSSTSYATLISDIDLNTFDFDVTSITGTNPSATAIGTSNGVGWSISPTTYWLARTKTNETFNFSSLPVFTDNLHASGNYTITFDRTVSSLLVALSNDNLTDSINFGLTASDFSGVSFLGTQVVLDSANGGLVLFENINSLTIQNTNTNTLFDGYDLAFHVVSTTDVPEPTILWLIGSGLGLIGFARRKKS